ncbi:MAG: DUF4065 domain-containing protein [Gammaproteobacteria bacterium]|nr:DUF4065 domain-containing protein [Gammaproteobacteria bacterium]
MAEAVEPSVPPCTAIEAANWFIQKGMDEDDPCDQMKVHKLVYFSHAWHLGNDMGPLFEEDVEAWQYGPVVPSLYRKIRKHGLQPIRELIQEFDWLEEKVKYPMPVLEYDEFFEIIWGIYRSWTGIQLSNATHREGEPWEIMNRRGYLKDKTIIRNSLIQQVYAQKVEELQDS